jgi:hypothetical protein
METKMIGKNVSKSSSAAPKNAQGTPMEHDFLLEQPCSSGVLKQ